MRRRNLRADPRDDAWSMTFFMPAEWSLDALPRPEDDSVTLEPAPAETVAAFRYSGLMTDADLERYQERLVAWLERQGYEPVGRARLAGYDPPWALPFLRRNEVQITVRRTN